MEIRVTGLSGTALYSGVLPSTIHLTLDGLISSLPISLSTSRLAVELHRLINRQVTELGNNPVSR